MAAVGKGFGKCILLGEHFVVYGVPAYAAALPYGMEVEAQSASVDRMPQGPYAEAGLLALSRIKANLGVKVGLEVTAIRSLLPVGAGLGSSAALSVAIADAVATLAGLNCTRIKLSDAAYEAEKAFHGNPSGIDNTVAALGGVLRYERRSHLGQTNVIEPLQVKHPLSLLVIETGEAGQTKVQVEKVAKFKQANEAVFERILLRAWDRSREFMIAWDAGDLQRLGDLFNSAQDDLFGLGVSSEKIELAIRHARDSGALGAKLTGAGGGGCALALYADPDALQLARSAFLSKGYQVHLVVVG